MRLLPPRGVQRQLAAILFVDRSGTGIYFTLSALYFTRIVGLSTIQVGSGLSIAAVASIFVGVPMGHLADRIGARNLMVAGQAGSALASAALLLVHTYHHDRTVAFPIEARAEGVVNGERKTIKLSLEKTSRDGVYALRQSWPKDGDWVLVITGMPGEGSVTALVSNIRGLIDRPRCGCPPAWWQCRRSAPPCPRSSRCRCPLPR